MNAKKRILLTVPSIGRDERAILEGLLDYIHGFCRSQWQVEIDFGEQDCCPIRIDPKDYDGFIDLVFSPEQRAAIRRRHAPTVLIEDVLRPSAAPGPKTVTLMVDHRSEGETAADYFLARHFRSFGWYGDDVPSDWNADRRKGFTDRLKQAGFDCSEFSGPTEDLKSWLSALPKPCAVYAVYDMRARRLIDMAVRAGFDVPNDIAVLGNGDDRIVCNTTAPTISSIRCCYRILGYNAGRVLAKRLTGHAPGGRLIRIRNTHVVSRLSTDVDAIEDHSVAEALTYVRNNLHARLGIDSISRKVGRSKHFLQDHALRQLGHPLGEEIRRIRLNAARKLLSVTDLPIAEVAETCGYNSVSHLSLRIKEASGLTPLAYRRRFSTFAALGG